MNAMNLELATPARTAVILQSSYLPWKGYFDLIAQADEFILFDDAQYTRRDWRNRNRIKTANGVQWLTIPVQVKGRFKQKINEVCVVDPGWAPTHWHRLLQAYGHAPFFSMYRDRFESAYRGLETCKLSSINRRFIELICNILSIKTRISCSMDYRLLDGQTERLIGLCRSVGANRYISGPAAKGYIRSELFQEAAIDLNYMSYDGYPEYAQLHGPFDHKVSVLDLIFNVGPAAPCYMKHVKTVP